MTTLWEELQQQPAAFRQMVAYYRQDPALFTPFTAANRTFTFTGMGASYHAGWIAASHCNAVGLPAYPVETIDFYHYTAPEVQRGSQLVYISQSGSSGEIVPLLEQHFYTKPLIGITNDLDSPLARGADLVLPMLGGAEELIAGKTYLNTLGILWLAVRYAAGLHAPTDWELLKRLPDQIESILDAARHTAERLQTTFDLNEPLVFLGHGPHAASARQAAMMMSEWAKIPALNAGIGAFRHGFIETIRPGMGVVIFSARGRTQESALRLADELSGYGARVLRIEQGHLLDPDEPSPAQVVDEFLSPILDIVPVQIFTEALAHHLGFPPGFRYIQKVVKSL